MLPYYLLNNLKHFQNLHSIRSIKSYINSRLHVKTRQLIKMFLYTTELTCVEVSCSSMMPEI